MNNNFYIKYLKYKNKYINLKNTSIQQIGGNAVKVLILCHPRIVTGSFSPLELTNHFYGLKNITGEGEDSIFHNIFINDNLQDFFETSGNPTFETVDILPGGTYQADAFSDEFINAHKNEYDLIMVPDCDGEWYIKQQTSEMKSFSKIRDFSPEEINKNLDDLKNYCIKLPQMLKKNGIILINKISHDLIVKLLDVFSESNGYRSEIRNIRSVGPVLIAKRLS